MASERIGSRVTVSDVPAKNRPPAGPRAKEGRLRAPNYRRDTRSWRRAGQVVIWLAFVAAACGGDDAAQPEWIDSFPYGRMVRAVPTTEKVVALTFDDGPVEPHTGRILDILQDRGVKATFFVVGLNITRFPEILLRIRDEGHAIGSHTWSHALLGPLTPAWRLAEVRHGIDVIEALGGERPTLFRPPGGNMGDSTELQRICRRLECLTVMWSVASMDHEDDAAPDAIAERVLRLVEPGGIVLLHDGDEIKTDPRRDATVQALNDILDGLSARGYRLVTVPELLAGCRGSWLLTVPRVP